MKPKLSIIIITKDTKDLLKNLLDSIKRDDSLKELPLEIMVIDNNSQDGTIDTVNKLFPEVIYIKNEKNLGFAKAANKGFFNAKGEYILFLNSDTVVLPGEIKRLINFMEGDKAIGICAPQLVYEDLSLQRSFAYIPRLIFEIVPRSFLEVLFPETYKGKKSRFESPQDVESLIGAAFMVRREAFEALNGFDERFFFFLEETDLCARARKMGFRVVFFPEAKIIHLQGKTISKTWVKGRIQYNISLYKFIKKHHNLFYFYVFVIVRFIKSLVMTVLLVTLPFLLINRRINRSLRYYFNLFTWHLMGCQDREGIKG